MRHDLPKRNTTRTRKRFLFLPKCVDRQVRWLEIAEWKEQLVEYRDGDTGFFRLRWEPIRWVNE